MVKYKVAIEETKSLKLVQPIFLNEEHYAYTVTIFLKIEVWIYRLAIIKYKFKVIFMSQNDHREC